MKLDSPFDSNVIPYLERYGSQVTAAGIRYGSVAYIGFGEARSKRITESITAPVYPVEIEIGADVWSLYANDVRVVDSNFSNIELARRQIEKCLVGRRVRTIKVLLKQSIIEFDSGTKLRSSIESDPASGFLYSFHVDGGQTWETIDGISCLD